VGQQPPSIENIEEIYLRPDFAAEIFDDVERVHADYLLTCDRLIHMLGQNADPEDTSEYIRSREPLLQLTREKLLAFMRAYQRSYDRGVGISESLRRFVTACYSYFDIVAGGQSGGGGERQTSYVALARVVYDLAGGDRSCADALQFVIGCRTRLVESSRAVADAYQSLRLTDIRPAAPVDVRDQGMVAAESEIDFGIVTMREDEFRAVLKRFPPAGEPVRGRRDYNFCRVETAGIEYRVVVARTLTQGNIEAANIAHDLLKDFRLKCLLLVGIAGGRPAPELTLGDVVVGTHVQDYTVHSVDNNGEPTFQVYGGAVTKRINSFIVNLPARPMGAWNSEKEIGIARPDVDLSALRLSGPPGWRKKVTHAMKYHFDGASRRSRFVTGPVIASDGVIKDPKVAIQWLESSRSGLAIEMESAGAYRVASENGVPFVTIRGISDIVGLDRDDRWAAYACETAASFTREFIRLRPPI